MRKQMALLGVNLKAMLTTFGGTGGNKKKKVSGVFAVGLMAVLSVYISGIYSFILASTLAPVGMLELMPVLIALMATLLSLLFTAFASSGIVFGSKDMDLMLSLPISSFSVMISKLLALYLENLVFTVFMLIPAGVAYLYSGGSGGVGFFLILLVSSLFVALIPTLLSLIVGFVLAWVQSRSQGKALLANLAYLVMFAGIFWFSFQINNVITGLVENGALVQSALETWLIPFGLFQKAIYGDVVSLLLMVVITLLPFLAITWVFSRFYQTILSKLSTHATRSDYRLGAMTAGGQISALLKKETSRFFGTPMYLFNFGIGLMMVIAAAVFACVQREMLSELRAVMPPDIVLPVLGLVLSFCLVMSCTSCVSISLEGKTLWILKEAPVSFRTLLLVKGGWNVFLIWITTLICVPMFWFALSLTPLEGIALLVLGLSFGVFTPCFGLVANLRFPKMDGVNDMLVIKQSISSFIAIFGGMILVGLGALLYWLLGGMLGAVGFVFLFSLVLLAVSVGLWYWMMKKSGEILLNL